MKTSTINHWEKKIQLAISLSHDDPYGERDLKAVAAMIGSSVDNFSHKFAQFYGMSYKHFTKRRRLEAGAGYLRHSDFNVAQISEMCGYTQSSFTKAFREMYDEAPLTFRNKLYLPNEINTLARTKIASNPHDDPHHLIFTPDRTEDVRLTDYTLYYNILPRNNDPVRSMVEYMSIYQQQLYAIKACLSLPGAMIITGTLDVVPVTDYSRMLMYVGIMVPELRAYDMAHLQIRLSFQEPFGLFTKQVPGGYYKKLPVPMSFAAAGLPMYEFINQSCRAGYFKMSGNHFFISLTGENDSEIFIPWQRR
ncbi:helix-turn-helix transcriptional regulator [Chitinophaga arvensicola]|uniref:AraC-type DNA-binding protein n=1 Tax=Chitinophaga arvensicola TaxID=29529 RepID=A0A1I0NH87_9BACT|nr:helix-turn-helix transcriptional regulator [Chitinophaga arvensicola]SEW00137.1 AraC-type DNA-binding protein [Chitinophaga arvensicola]